MVPGVDTFWEKISACWWLICYGKKYGWLINQTNKCNTPLNLKEENVTFKERVCYNRKGQNQQFESGGPVSEHELLELNLIRHQLTNRWLSGSARSGEAAGREFNSRSRARAQPPVGFSHIVSYRFWIFAWRHNVTTECPSSTRFVQLRWSPEGRELCMSLVLSVCAWVWCECVK
jgi:hypothetical protein